MATFSQTAWYDKAFISISPLSGAETEMRAKTTTLSISGGAFDVEGIETFGGKVTRVGTRDDIEIKFDAIVVQPGDIDWLQQGETTSTITSSTTFTARQMRLTFLWTDQTSVTSAVQAITSTNQAYRRVYANAYCTNAELNMDAGDYLKGNLTFKLATDDSTGTQNYKYEAKGTESGTMSAIPAFTSSSTKW